MKETLAEFLNRPFNPDGFYAVWKSGFFPDPNNNDKRLFGFSGGVAEFSENGGFKNYPEWMDEDKLNEDEVFITLLQELPTISEF